MTLHVVGSKKQIRSIGHETRLPLNPGGNRMGAPSKQKGYHGHLPGIRFSTNPIRYVSAGKGASRTSGTTVRPVRGVGGRGRENRELVGMATWWGQQDEGEGGNPRREPSNLVPSRLEVCKNKREKSACHVPRCSADRRSLAISRGARKNYPPSILSGDEGGPRRPTCHAHEISRSFSPIGPAFRHFGRAFGIFVGSRVRPAFPGTTGGA